MTQGTTYHYQIIRRAIAAIDAADMPLSLDQLAQQAGLSSAHFQRVFTAWVGVSPKRYQQYLTLDHAKYLLREKCTTLQTAHNVGLSGTSRLHDLFVRWEAMTPGDFAKQASSLTIYEGWFDSPFGDMIAMGTELGICGLAFASEMGRDSARQDLAQRWPMAQFTIAPEKLRPWVDAAFAGHGETKLMMIGAPLQIKVWEALLNVPTGHVTTYSQIAQRIDSPKAVRAVGTAVGRNPVSYIIPCHRALRKSGEMGGYHWGLPVKRAMLAYEGARADA